MAVTNRLLISLNFLLQSLFSEFGILEIIFLELNLDSEYLVDNVKTCFLNSKMSLFLSSRFFLTVALSVNSVLTIEDRFPYGEFAFRSGEKSSETILPSYLAP